MAAAAALTFGAALGAVSLLVSDDAVREAAKAELRMTTGLDPVMRGATKVSLFPTGSVSFADVALGQTGNGEPALTVDRLVARLKFFPLLVGRVEIADVQLLRPTIAVALDASGRSNWSGLVDKLASSQRLDQDHTFSEIGIVDGTLVVTDAGRGVSERLTDVALSLAWPSISKGFAITGRAVWRDEPVDVSLTVSDFAAALNGTRTGVKARIAGKPVKFAFDGNASTRPTFKLEGNLSADGTSLRDTLRWVGHKPMPAGGFGRFALKAQTSVAGSNVALSAVNLDLDGNNVEGVLTLSADPRPTLKGTLAAEKLDITPYLSSTRLIADDTREWDAVPMRLDWLDGTELDLRLSAAEVNLTGAKLGRTALALNLRNRRLDITVGESQAYGGSIKGTMSLTSVPPNAEVTAQLQFNEVNLESSLGQLFGLRRLEGTGNVILVLEGAGPNVLAITRTLNGAATMVARKGALAGINVEQLLRRLERRPLSGGGEFRSGRTPYERLSVALRIVQGSVNVEDVAIEGPAVRLAIAGSASIPARDLDLKGVAGLVPPPSSQNGFELPFIVQGSWDDPVMLPDTQSLIRRSGAAAPLFDTVRDKRARDAVLQAIQRLTGGVPLNIPAVPASEQAPAAQ